MSPKAKTTDKAVDELTDILTQPRKLEKTAKLNLGHNLYSDLTIKYTDNLTDADLSEILADVSILKIILEDIYSKPIALPTQTHSNTSVPANKTTSPTPPTRPTNIPSNIKPPSQCKKCGSPYANEDGSANMMYVTGIGKNSTTWHGFDCKECDTPRTTKNGIQNYPTRNFVDPIVVTKATNDVAEDTIPF